MLKVLHFSLHKHIPMGVMNQLLSEYAAAKQLNSDIKWKIKVFSHDATDLPFHAQVKRSDISIRIISTIKDYIALRIKAYGWFLKNRKYFDITLFRYRSGDVFLYFTSKFFNNVITIHHSKAIDEAKTRYGSGGRLEEFIETHLGKRALLKTSGIIGVTLDIASYERNRTHTEKPLYCYPNGIDTTNYPVAGDQRRSTVNLIFISSCYTKWHGLDLVIDEIRKSNEKLVLHIIGDIETGSFECDSRIKFYGRKNRHFILELFEKCDLGLGSFALSRIGLSESCHLKVREYLAAGLPVYSGYPDSGLPIIFPFYKVGQLNIKKIIEFAQVCRNFSRQEIRQSSEKYINKLEIMKGLVEWLKQQGYSH